jgi:hypothetical protein
MKTLTKKGQAFDQISGLVIGVAAFAIVIVIVFLIIAGTKTNLADNSYACDASTSIYNSTAGNCCTTGSAACTGANITGLSHAWNATTTLRADVATLPGWVPIVIIIIVGSILIGLVGMFKR